MLPTPIWPPRTPYRMIETRTREMGGSQGDVSENRAHSSSFQSLHLRQKLILQPVPRFTYVTTHSPTLPLLHLRHSSFSNPFFGSPMSQDFHLRHQASCPCHNHLFGIVVSMSVPSKRSQVQFLAIPFTFSASVGSGTGFTQPREDNWVAT